MPVIHLSTHDTHDTRRAGSGLLDVLQEWRDTDGVAVPESHVPERRAIEANRALIELAVGALMARYGVDRFKAFALIVRWSRLTHTPVHRLVQTVVHDLDEVDAHTDARHRPLIRWLEGSGRPRLRTRAAGAAKEGSGATAYAA